MRIRLGQEPKTVEEKIEHPSFGSFWLSVLTLDLVGKTRYWDAEARGDVAAVLDLRLAAISGWRELYDDAGEPIPFNKENLDKVLSANDDLFAAVVSAVDRVFHANRTALTEEQRKNSEAPLSP